MTTLIDISVPAHIEAVEVLFEKRMPGDHEWSTAEYPLVVLAGTVAKIAIWDDKRIFSIRECSLNEVKHLLTTAQLRVIAKVKTNQMHTKLASIAASPIAVSPIAALTSPVVAEPDPDKLVTLQEVHDHGC